MVPLLEAAGGPYQPVTDPRELLRWADALAAPGGPVALDAERASGFRYGSRAYLVQLRRADLGTVLLDPIALGDLAVLDAPLAQSEWVLHAASQDLACLADAGIRPRRLFDTELAGRLAGVPRVGLAPLVEQMLGLGLAKGHGAADWSTRPLPEAWLNYAALDVEVLLELRDAMADLLERQGKLEFAHQEFAALVNADPAPPRADPWRRTSGIHSVRDSRGLAVVRELWKVRDDLARRRNVAPHRVLPDSALITAANARPANLDALTALPVFSGRIQRRQAQSWFAAVQRAMSLNRKELPEVSPAGNGPPPAPRWAGKDPVAAARLADSRRRLAELSAQWSIPVENLISPELVRRLLWSPPPPDEDEVRRLLAAGGARPWQVDLTAGLLTSAIAAHPNAGTS